eukprot:scaffold43351_cov46-Phaeocystis_antarctica.AAC.5
MAAAAGEAVPLLRFESLCGALRTGLTEAITLKTQSDKGAAAFLALQSSAMGLIELKEVPPPPSPPPPSPPPPSPPPPLSTASQPSATFATVALATAPQVNRTIWEKVAEAKDSCKAVSLDMDVADLRLQNLQYEKNHLARPYPYL